MKKICLLLLLGCIYVLPLNAKGKMTYVSAEITGFEDKTIFFDFVEKEALSTEIPYMENQVMEVSGELDDVTMLRINAWIYVCLQPGDSLHAKIVYDGKYHKSVEYSGTPSAVAINTALQNMRESRRVIRLKTNIPALLVTMVDAKEYCSAARDEWEKEVGMLDGVKDQVSPRVYNYVMSEIDGIFLTNLINYPFASAGYHKKELQDCMLDDYWSMLDAYKIRDDEASLRNRTYMFFLITYKTYMRCKEAGNNVERFIPNQKMEDEYADLASFYDGAARDAALFTVLYNAIVNAVDFDRIEKLRKDYLKKYNINKEYKKILAQVMK